MALTEEQKQAIIAKGGTILPNGTVQNASQYGLEAGYARKSPTIATSETPVISKKVTNDLSYDETNPEDYLMQLNAKTVATKKLPTQTELYNMYKAQKAIQDKARVNPFIDGQAGIQSQLDTARTEETTADQQALEAYKKQLDIDYANKIKEAEMAGTKQQQAAQRVYSFSGFGRSSAAANKSAEIEASTQSAISSLNAAKELAIQTEKARLANSDPKVIQSLEKQLEAYQKSATDWQMEAIKATADANKSAGASYTESINNMIKAVQDSGLDMDAKGFELAAKAMKGMTAEQQKTYLAQFTPQEQAMLLGLTSATPSETTGTGKNMRIWNAKTGKRETVSGGAGGAGGRGAGSAAATSNDVRMNDALSNLAGASMATRKAASLGGIAGFISPATAKVQSEYNYIKNNLMLGDFVQLKKQGATFGAMSEAEWKAIKDASTLLNYNLSDADRQKEINIIRNNLSKAAQRARINQQGQVVPEGQQVQKTYKQTATNPKTGEKIGSNDGINREPIK